MTAVAPIATQFSLVDAFRFLLGPVGWLACDLAVVHGITEPAAESPKTKAEDSQPWMNGTQRPSAVAAVATTAAGMFGV